MTHPIDAVIFDMDGTLFDSTESVTDGFIETIVTAGGARYTAQDIIGSFPQGSPGPILTHLLGRPYTDEELGDYHARLDAASDGLAPYDGIRECLDALGARGVRLALFTGADLRSVEILLARTALQGRFEVVTAGNEVAHAKPAPDGILLSCDRLDLPSTAVAYVGDSPADMEAAKAAGARPIGAGWGRLWTGVEGVEVAAAPADLPALVAR
jgi:HAD superfamily hydrolase (TIGR01549 family)